MEILDSTLKVDLNLKMVEHHFNIVVSSLVCNSNRSIKEGESATIPTHLDQNGVCV